MFWYILKRLLIFIPTFVVISLLTFIISQNAPGDPIEQILGGNAGNNEARLSGKEASEKAYKLKRQELGLNYPIFYFSFATQADPDTLFNIPDQDHRAMLKRLIDKYGNWDEISDYYYELKDLETSTFQVQKDSLNAPALIKVKSDVTKLFSVYKASEIEGYLSEINEVSKDLPSLGILHSQAMQTLSAFNAIQENKTPWKSYIPSFKWYGSNSQYHRWLFGHNNSGGFIRGDFGISYADQRPAAERIGEALKKTLILSLLAIFITYIIAIPLGIYSAVRKGGIFDQTVTTILFMFYSLPAFWIGTLLIIFLGGGDFLSWFPPSRWTDVPADAPMAVRIQDIAWHIVLPLICLTYPTFAFLNRQARGAILNVFNQDYIRTARAKGLSEKTVVWKHAFRNSLLPIITMFANILPYAIGGSFVVEVVFTIEGMGKLLLESLISRDYPMIYTLVMLATIMTMIGYLLSDILYAMADPRITYSSKKK